LLSLALLLTSATLARAGDWPQWLGPNRDGSSPEKVAPWKGDLKVLWKQAVGEAHSSPVVAGGKVFLHTRVAGKDAEEVTAYDAKTGEKLWNVSYPRAAFGTPFGNGPRATPSVVDGKVYTYGITGILTCLQAADGKQLWQVDCLKEFKGKNLFFGVSSSPLVEGNRVMALVGAQGASVVAFEKDTGKVAWKALDDRASYASPIAIGQGKDRQLVFLTGEGLIALAPKDGSLFWRFELKDKLNESSTTPVKIGDLLLASSVTYGSVALKQTISKEQKLAVEQLWKNAALTCYFSTPVPVGADHVYLVTGELALKPESKLHCVETKTGKVLWTRPKTAKYHAALLRTGDDKLLMLDDFGQLTLIDPNPKEFRQLAQSKVCGATWAHPALSDGRLYLRDEKELICVQLAE
jgi:outer membrane protein assembly factor BamB